MGYPLPVITIYILDFSSRPAAISGLVIAVVVDAINGMISGRSRPHVGEKIFERIRPSLADSNSTTAIETVVLIVGVVAAAFNALPAGVFSSTALSVPSVDSAASAASASFCISPSQRRGINRQFLSAIAFTEPEHSRVSAMREPQSNEFSESKSRQVFESSWTMDKLRISHDAISQIGCEVVRAGGRVRVRSARLIMALFA